MNKHESRVNNNRNKRVGETNINCQGIKMEILEYNSTNDILVKFYDDYNTILNGSYYRFKNGKLKNMRNEDGTKSGIWTDNEISIFKENYNTIEDIIIAEKLERSKESISQKARKLGLKKYQSSKDGYVLCKKCLRELPREEKYFDVDKECSDGMRNICRECSKAGKFREDNFIYSGRMTKEEEKLFINRYPHYCNEELIELFYPDKTLKALHDTAYRISRKLGIELYKTEESLEMSRFLGSQKVAEIFKGVPKSEEHKRKLSESMRSFYDANPEHDAGKYERSQACRKKMSQIRKSKGIWKGDKNPRHINPLFGKDNGRWNGGNSELVSRLRARLKPWKIDSMEACGYKCVITGERFDVIHHIVPFYDILAEVFDELGIDMRNKIGDYSEEEFELIVEKMLEVHYRYPLGACLKREYHLEFHDIYGYIGATEDNFKEYLDLIKEEGSLA